MLEQVDVTAVVSQATGINADSRQGTPYFARRIITDCI